MVNALHNIEQDPLDHFIGKSMVLCYAGFSIFLLINQFGGHIACQPPQGRIFTDSCIPVTGTFLMSEVFIIGSQVFWTT